ncbi:hypothetical protein ACJRO7_010380 [Eucalyptus globulus]|uniref:Uncharacterized protein n=1 Tax=Eucalyptus globulus TaxID=34317 RepID=A0ABD3LCN9_EUCGL
MSDDLTDKRMATSIGVAELRAETGTRTEEVGSTARPEQIGRFEDGDGEMSDDLTGKRMATALTARMDSESTTLGFLIEALRMARGR